MDKHNHWTLLKPRAVGTASFVLFFVYLHTTCYFVELTNTTSQVMCFSWRIILKAVRDKRSTSSRNNEKRTGQHARLILIKQNMHASF